jgi:hypothetical protein
MSSSTTRRRCIRFMTLTVKDYISSDILAELNFLVAPCRRDDLVSVLFSHLDGERSYGTRTGRDVGDLCLANVPLNGRILLPGHVRRLSRHPRGTDVGAPRQVFLVLEDLEGGSSEELGVLRILLFGRSDSADVGGVGYGRSSWNVSDTISRLVAASLGKLTQDAVDVDSLLVSARLALDDLGDSMSADTVVQTSRISSRPVCVTFKIFARRPTACSGGKRGCKT